MLFRADNDTLSRQADGSGNWRKGHQQCCGGVHKRLLFRLGSRGSKRKLERSRNPCCEMFVRKKSHYFFIIKLIDCACFGYLIILSTDHMKRTSSYQLGSLCDSDHRCTRSQSCASHHRPLPSGSNILQGGKQGQCQSMWVYKTSETGAGYTSAHLITEDDSELAAILG